MRKVSYEEFKECIKRLIRREITKVNLAKELETDCRTLDNKIQELAATDLELYEEYVKALPYKQKGYDHIDFEALIIYILKNGMTIEEGGNQFGISRRTMNRRINSMQNKELAELYKKVAYNRKHVIENSVDIVRQINALETRPIVLGKVNDRRKAELLKIESEFNELCKTMTKDEAAKRMGLGTSQRVYKLLHELYKLQIEEQHIEDKNSDFKERIKVDVNSVVNVVSDGNTEQISKEGKELE